VSKKDSPRRRFAGSGKCRYDYLAVLQFGSRYPGDPRRMTPHDFCRTKNCEEVDNLRDFAGMLVFDKWTCNTNGRQTVFFEARGERRGLLPEAGERRWRVRARKRPPWPTTR
jgi:hypothetical protein